MRAVRPSIGKADVERLRLNGRVGLRFAKSLATAMRDKMFLASLRYGLVPKAASFRCPLASLPVVGGIESRAFTRNVEPRKMDSQSFDRKVAGSTVTLEIAPSAMWVPLAARTGRTFDTTPCVGLATQGLWILVLAMVTFHPVSAFGAESVDDIGFFASAVLVLGGPVIGAMFIYGLLNILRGATTWPWTTTTLAYLLWSRIPWNFAKADIASILVPLVDHARIEGGTIQFVGSDGGYLTGPKRDALVSAIEKWVKNGYKVRYILVSPGDEATSSLEALKRSLGDRLEVFVLTPPKKQHKRP